MNVGPLSFRRAGKKLQKTVVTYKFCIVSCFVFYGKSYGFGMLYGRVSDVGIFVFRYITCDNCIWFSIFRLADMGLETFKLSELFTSIVIPGFFLLACILQLHYFHKPFMKITDLENVTPIHRHEHYLWTNALIYI